jgi:hypothetical protein
MNSSETVVLNDEFLSELTVPFDSLGRRLSFTLALTGPTSKVEGVPDLCALYIHPDSLHRPPIPTTDPTGMHALFTLESPLRAQVHLTAFAPTRFVPPDSLVIRLPADGATPPSRAEGEVGIQLLPPSGGQRIRIGCDVPNPGGRIRLSVLEASGWKVHEMWSDSRPPGPWVVEWEGEGLGKVREGDFFALVEFAGQTRVIPLRITLR